MVYNTVILLSYNYNISSWKKNLNRMFLDENDQNNEADLSNIDYIVESEHDK